MKIQQARYSFGQHLSDSDDQQRSRKLKSPLLEWSTKHKFPQEPHPSKTPKRSSKKNLPCINGNMFPLIKECYFLCDQMMWLNNTRIKGRCQIPWKKYNVAWKLTKNKGVKLNIYLYDCNRLCLSPTTLLLNWHICRIYKKELLHI